MSALILTLTLLAGTQAPHDWPQWRGALRDGVSLEREWSSVGAPLWKRNVGLGLSSASIVAGRVYTLGFDEEQGLDTLFCLEAETGKDVWTASYPAQLRAQDHAGGTLTTPTVVGDRLYVSNREGELRCFDKNTGALHWLVNVPELAGTEPNPYGFSGSPLVVQGRVIVNVDRAVALDTASGELMWQSEPIDAQFSTPVAFELGGELRLADFTQSSLFVLDLANGAPLYEFGWSWTKRGVNASSPVVVGEELFVSSAYERGCALLSFAGEQAEAVWQNRRMRNKMAGCVLVNDLIFGFDESMLKCLDLEGNERWRERGLGNGAVIGAGDRLILTSSKGELIVAAASGDEYRELSRSKVFDGGTFWTPPVIAAGRVYLRSSLGEVVCRDHRPGAKGAASSEPLAAAEKPAARELFTRHLERIGGGTALLARTGIRRRGTFDMRSVGVVPVPFEINQRAPGFFHAKIKLPGDRPGHFVRVFDGEVAYELNPYLGDSLLADELQQEYATLAELHLAANYEAAYRSLETVGVEEFADRPCWRVDGQTRYGTQRSVFFSVETGLLTGRKSDQEAIAVFDEYREFEGLWLPTLEKYFVPGTGIEETFWTEEVEFVDVDSALFERPASIQELMDQREAPDRDE